MDSVLGLSRRSTNNRTIQKKPHNQLITELILRKLGDSNPRYGNPYVSLANWWFQPLTQTSFLGSAYGTRTRVSAVRGPRPRPLDEGAIKKSDRDRIQTCNRLIRSQLLYSVELRGHYYWRKLGDSNPRYGNPYVSLANWWFQPLTQTSFFSVVHFFKCGAKICVLSDISKHFLTFLSFFLLLFNSRLIIK